MPVSFAKTHKTLFKLFRAAETKKKKRLVNRLFVAPVDADESQPPFLGRLPGFFLLRVDVPRSRLTFWPCGADALWPFGGIGLGAQMSASTLILLGMKGSGLG